MPQATSACRHDGLLTQSRHIWCPLVRISLPIDACCTAATAGGPIMYLARRFNLSVRLSQTLFFALTVVLVGQIPIYSQNKEDQPRPSIGAQPDGNGPYDDGGAQKESAVISELDQLINFQATGDALSDGASGPMGSESTVNRPQAPLLPISQFGLTSVPTI